ncbi:uncharacterized protein LOC108669897 [Hyalella azteca]|uniref:Uncharacterized protein LOC108669897 n=1 Tax=Hyalella azteca TaxID=294128 RepID=A0A8B7NGR5_HYAAZ|nr:uncharacterized protein LOC108669897 [Hyalella azteca]
MASATIECDICNENFDSGNHKPLCLTCGHTFCFSCITNLLRLPGTQNCPQCRKPFSQQIDQIIVNYVLIPSENTARGHPPSSQSEAPCLHQGKALDYLCVDCMELVCFACTRGTHVTHKIELIGNLSQENQAVLSSWMKIRTTMHDKLGSGNNLVSVSDDILSLMDEILNLKTDFHGWKDSLAQKMSKEHDLHAWDVTLSGVDENQRHECREMLCRLKLKPPENVEIPEIRARLNAALKKCDSLQIQGPAVTATARQCPGAGAALPRIQNDLQAPHPKGATAGATPRTFQVPVLTYEHGVPWTVTSCDEGERAVASLSSNIKPSRLVVVSTHTSPIPGLGQLLTRLAAHHRGDISLLPLDSFWAPPGQPDGGMGAIINKSGVRLDTMYGSHGQFLDYFNKRHRVGMQSGATRAWPCRIGLRLGGNDFYWSKYLPKKIDDACCVRGTPRNVSSKLRKNGCRVTRWHFPNVCDDDLDWMISILHRFKDSRLSLVLPRNGLTATGARRLFAKLPQIREVYHDPGAALLKSAGSAPDLSFIELSTNNIIHWI